MALNSLDCALPSTTKSFSELPSIAPIRRKDYPCSTPNLLAPLMPAVRHPTIKISLPIIPPRIIVGLAFIQTTVADFKPADGFVPTKEVAIKIARPSGNPFMARSKSLVRSLFQTQLENGIWIVEGSLPNGYLGGVAEAHISKEDGRILSVKHGK